MTDAASPKGSSGSPLASFSSDNRVISKSNKDKNAEIHRNRHNLCKPRQKKFAPFTKVQRLRRRKEVYRLHFEKGHSALHIAEMMHVDRNTINNDIRILYRELDEEWKNIAYGDFITKQVIRLEFQRARLISQLDKGKVESSVDNNVSLERLISDIDLKLLSAAIKIQYSDAAFWDSVYRTFNHIAEEKKLDYKLTTLFQAVQLSRQNNNTVQANLAEPPL